MSLFPCPCCGYQTLPKQPPGSYEICPICCWEDAYAEHVDETSNEGTLWQAQKNFDEIGACESQWLDTVRAVTNHDRRAPNWIPTYRVEQNLIDEISVAFANVSYRSTSLRQAKVFEYYGTRQQFIDAGKLDSDTHWSEVPDEDIEAHSDIFLFLSDNSFHYYIPAYMTWSIKYYRSNCSMSLESTINALELDPGYLAEGTRGAQLARFALLTRTQSVAVLKFLQFMINYADMKELSAVIEQYWGRFADETIHE